MRDVHAKRSSHRSTGAAPDQAGRWLQRAPLAKGFPKARLAMSEGRNMSGASTVEAITSKWKYPNVYDNFSRRCKTKKKHRGSTCPLFQTRKGITSAHGRLGGDAACTGICICSDGARLRTRYRPPTFSEIFPRHPNLSVVARITRDNSLVSSADNLHPQRILSRQKRRRWQYTRSREHVGKSSLINSALLKKGELRAPTNRTKNVLRACSENSFY